MNELSHDVRFSKAILKAYEARDEVMALCCASGSEAIAMHGLVDLLDIDIEDARSLILPWFTKNNVADASRIVEEHNRGKVKEGQYLYRLYGRGGELLYVGITNNPYRRWAEHSKEKPWWPQVHRHEHEWFPNREAVDEAERRAIQVENPKYNIANKAAR